MEILDKDFKQNINTFSLSLWHKKHFDDVDADGWDDLTCIENTEMFLSFRTDIPGKQCRPRLIRVYTVCHTVCIVWTHYSMVEQHSSNFRVITTNILDVRIFRKFTVMKCLWMQSKANNSYIMTHFDRWTICIAKPDIQLMFFPFDYN